MSTVRKIIVTGGAGFIGSALVRHLIAHTSHRVLNIDLLTYAGHPSSLRGIEENPRYAFLRADIADRDAITLALKEFRPDAIMNLAAESHVDRSIAGPAPFLHTNILGTANLLECVRAYLALLPEAQRRDFRFHHISTDEVYGSLAGDGYFIETSPYAPRSPYSASKASADHLVRAWHHTYGLPVLLTNGANNFGPCQHPEKLIPKTILKALKREPIPLYGNGLQIRDWIHADDHVRALVAVLERGTPGETYLIGANCEKRNLDVVNAICDLIDNALPVPVPRRSLITFVADRPGHDRRYGIDASKIRTQLGWAPDIGFDEGLKQTVQWYLENRPWWEAIRESE